MLGEDIKSLNGDIKDAVGEITNMVSGVARQKLEQEGVVLKAAIPTVVTAKSHSISHVLGGPMDMHINRKRNNSSTGKTNDMCRCGTALGFGSVE